MDNIDKAHDAMTMILGSAADAGGIVIAFHIDSYVSDAVIICLAIHTAYGLFRIGYRWYQQHNRTHVRIVGFVPPR